MVEHAKYYIAIKAQIELDKRVNLDNRKQLIEHTLRQELGFTQVQIETFEAGNEE